MMALVLILYCWLLLAFTPRHYASHYADTHYFRAIDMPFRFRYSLSIYYCCRRYCHYNIFIAFSSQMFHWCHWLALDNIFHIIDCHFNISLSFSSSPLIFLFHCHFHIAISLPHIFIFIADFFFFIFSLASIFSIFDYFFSSMLLLFDTHADFHIY